MVIKEDIVKELKQLGLETGDAVMVHTSLKSMGYVCGGAQAVIEALIEIVGAEGTIMMPTQSWRLMRRTGRRSVRTGLPMISGSLPPIPWGPWRRCFASGRAVSEVIIRQGLSVPGENMQNI